MKDRSLLERECRRMDGGPYPAYRDLLGPYQLRGLACDVLRVQPDPFAGPSRVRWRIPYASTALDPALGALPGGRGAREPGRVDADSARAVGIRDYLGRKIGLWLEQDAAHSGRRPAISIVPHGQEVLDRSAVFLHGDSLEVRLNLDLPARGRMILGREALELLLHVPERVLQGCLGPGALDPGAVNRHAQVVEDFAHLQELLPERGWIAFVADGSLLARRAGNDDRPLREGPLVPFESPAGMRHGVRLPHAGTVAGMALEPGVTLLCGGGFHGKSTLLRTLAACILPHVPGDGRERAATRPDAMCVRAEDGRAVFAADLRPFLHDLPFALPASEVTTENASGSTSQAAGILEAIQDGSRLLLMDEDTSATNFMIRDALMERLLTARQEPITPFLARARALHDGCGVSSILVLGGSGEYFRVADRVIVLDTYRPLDRTEEARRIAAERTPLPADDAAVESLRTATDPDRPLPSGPQDGGPGRSRPGGPRIKALGPRRLLVNSIPLELDGLESLRDPSQARFLVRVLAWRQGELARSSGGSQPRMQTTRELTDALALEWRVRGLDGFGPEIRGDLAAVRVHEVLAAVRRLRDRPAPGQNWALGEAEEPERAGPTSKDGR